MPRIDLRFTLDGVHAEEFLKYIESKYGSPPQKGAVAFTLRQAVIEFVKREVKK